MSQSSMTLSLHIMYIHIYITESLYVHQKLTQCCKSTTIQWKNFFLIKKDLLLPINYFVSVFQSLSHAQLFATPWTAEHQASLSFTISQSLLKLMSIELVMPSGLYILASFVKIKTFKYTKLKITKEKSAISSSVIPFSFCLLSFPAWEYLPIILLFTSVAKVLEFQLQHKSFQWIFRTDFL